MLNFRCFIFFYYSFIYLPCYMYPPTLSYLNMRLNFFLYIARHFIFVKFLEP